MPKFHITEHIGEAWMQERVSFPVVLPGSLDPGRLAVRDDSGSMSPAQFVPDSPGSRKGRVHFVVDLLPRARRTWTLVPAKAEAKTDLFLKESRDSVEFGTSRIAVRCPFGTQNWPQGLSAADAPAPIQAIRLTDGTWGCKGTLHSPFKVLSISGQTLVSGPVFARIRLTYTFEGGRTYTAEMEAIAGQEVLVISERSGLGDDTEYLYRLRPKGAPNWNTLLALYNDAFYKKSSYWTLSFAEGLSADRLTWQPFHQMWSIKPNQSREEPHEGGNGVLIGGRSDGDDPEPGEPRYTFAPPKRACHLVTLNPMHGEWWLNVSKWFGVYSSQNKNFLAMMAWRAGDWRKPHCNVPVLQCDEQGRMRAVMPINTGARVWGLYGGPRDTSIYYPRDWPNARAFMKKPPKGERYPQVEYARPPQLAWIKYGYLPLDMVKDWVLEWDDPPGTVYPHIFAKAEEMLAIRRRIAQTPMLKQFVDRLKATWDAYMASNDPNYPFYSNHFKGPNTYLRGLDNIYLATGDEVYAKALVPLLIDRLHRYTHTVKAHRGLEPDIIEPYLVRQADIALGARSTTSEQKREIRALLAFSAYLFLSPNHAPRGLGYNNHGNTDLEAVKYMTVGSIGCLLSGHPGAHRWAQGLKDAIEKVLSHKEHLPGLTQDEWYSFYNLEIVIYGAMQLKRAGFADYFSDPRVREGLEFFGKLLTVPDERHGGAGSVVPFGNGQGARNRSVAWAIAAAELADRDPEFASRMMWYWRRAGSPGELRIHGDRVDFGWSSLGWIDATIPAVKPHLGSEYLQGWGALFRSGYGTPHETFMALQLGKRDGLANQYNAEGGFHLYARGKPLCMIAGLRSYDVGLHRGFTNVVRQRWMANRPSFNRCSEVGEGTGKLLRWATTRGADLAAGEWTFSHLVALPNPGPKEGPDRLILSKPRPEEPGVGIGQDKHKDVPPITWRRHVMLVRDADPEGPNYFVIRDAVSTTVPWDWNVWCLATELSIQQKAGHFTGKYGVDLDVVPLEPVPELVTGSWGPTESFAGYWHQRLYQVQLPGSGQFAAVLYPRLHDDPAPAITPWAGGAGAKLTLPGQTHYVLMADQPKSVAEDGITIGGRAALVRIKADVTTLDLLSGTSVGTKDLVLSVTGDGATSVTLDAGKKFITGESHGSERKVTLQLPQALAVTALLIDGKAADMTVPERAKVQFVVPDGDHTFSLK